MTKTKAIEFLTHQGFVAYVSSYYWDHLADTNGNRASVSPERLTLMLADRSHVGRHDYPLDTLEVVNDHLYVRVAPDIFN